MKNIAIPLLLAKSAEGQRVEAEMKQDLAFPKPVLIADAWKENEICDDDADGDVASASATLSGLEDELVALQATMDENLVLVDTAIQNKADNVALVIEADAALADDLAADNAAQVELLNLQALLDTADFNLSVASALKDATVDALADADQAVEDAIADQVDTDQAFVDAGTNKGDEEDELGDIGDARDDAQEDLDGTVTPISDAQGLYDSAKEDSDPAEATTARRLIEKTDAQTLFDKLTVLKTAADNDVLADYQDGDGNKGAGFLKADAFTANDLLETAIDSSTWQATARNIVTDFAAYETEDSDKANSFTSVHATNGCETIDGGGHLSANLVDGTDNDDEDKCAASCMGKLAWPTTDGRPNASTSSSGGSDGATIDAITICYGYEFSSDSANDSTNVPSCIFMLDQENGAGSKSDVFKCMKRDRSGLAADYFNLEDGISDTDITDNVPAWETDLPLYYQTVSDLALATDYATKIEVHYDAASGDKDTTSNDYDSDKTDALTGSDALSAVTAQKLSDLQDRELEGANFDALLQALLISYAKQEVELAKETLVYDLADAAKQAQDTLVGDLEDAQGLASDAKDDADEDYEQKVLDQETASNNYTTYRDGTATDTAAAVATPLEELGELRDASAELDLALASALEDYVDAENLVTLKAEEVQEKTAEKMATIVACKAEKYDEYWNTWMDAVGDRESDLETIEDLLTDQVIPERGSAGARCEKALSNGTWRQARDETTCNEGLCCGAAKIPMGNVMMTIETCQAEATVEVQWGPARGPMETTVPDTDPYPFTCIDGAQKLAAAASALAAAVYMLA